MEPIQIASLMVYNSSYGNKEGEEEEKLLYYFPAEEKTYKKINNVGLCEALVQFTQTLSPGFPCEYLHTHRHKYVFYEAEDHFWLVMVLSNPTVATSDGKTQTKENEIIDSAYKALLKELYMRFRVLHGFFSYVLQQHDVDVLKTKLDIHFQEFLPALNLSDCNVLHVFRGLSYCSLGKSSLLKFQSCVNTIQSKFKNIRYCIIMSNNGVITSSIPEEDTHVLVSLFRERLKLDYPVAGRTKATSHATTQYALSHGKFISNLFCGTESKLFICANNETIEPLQLLVYQAYNVTSFLFVDDMPTTLLELCKQLDLCIGPLLASLTSEINAKPQNNLENYEPNLKHIYIDQHSLAIQSTCHSTRGGSCTCSVPVDVMHVMSDINESFNSCTCTDKEVINKVQNDSWVAAKKTNKRMLFAVINSKNANLIGVNEDVRKMTAHFDSMYFSD